MTIHHPPGTLPNAENFISRDLEHLPKKLIVLFATYGVNANKNWPIQVNRGRRFSQ